MVELASASVNDGNALTGTSHQTQQVIQQEIMEAIQNPAISEAMVNETWLTSDISNLDLSATKLLTDCVPNYSEQNILGVNGGCSSFPKPCKREPEYVKVNQVDNLWGYDFESNDPFSVGACMDNNKVDNYIETQNSLSLWPSGTEENAACDAIFQVDKNDLIQNPTLAELNANEDPLLELLDYDTLFALNGKSFFAQENKFSAEPVLNQTDMVAPPASDTAEYNAKPEPKMSCISPNLSGNGQNKTGNLMYFSSPSAVVNDKATVTSAMQLNQAEAPNLKERIPTLISMSKTEEDKQSTLLSQLLCKNDTQPASTTTNDYYLGVISRTPQENEHSQTNVQNSLPLVRMLSNHNENYSEGTINQSTVSSIKSEECENHAGNISEATSDEDSQDSEADDDDMCSSKWTLNSGSQRNDKRKRYFWQYNVQAKGPKGPRIVLTTEPSDPHVLNSATDPVFSPACQLEGVKHAGKARRGDGNDLTPNPRKLYLIGLELKKLNRHINDLKPVSELPSNARTRSRKEKNKLASRACRLKKKAQHEANKLKLFGLQREHKHLLDLLEEAKKLIRRKVEFKQESPKGSCIDLFDGMVKLSVLPKVAGRTTEFVNSILDQVTLGNNNGGLDKL